MRSRCRTTWLTPRPVFPGELGRMCCRALRQSGPMALFCLGCAKLLRSSWGQQGPALASSVSACSLRHFLAKKVRMSQNERFVGEKQRLHERSTNSVHTVCVVAIVCLHGRSFTGARVCAFVHRHLHMRSHLLIHARAFVMVPKTKERSTKKHRQRFLNMMHNQFSGTGT